MRTSWFLLALLAVGCTSQPESPGDAFAAQQTRSCGPIRGDPLPTDCRGATRPVTSGLAAVCIARKAVPVDARPISGGEWHYSVTFRDSHWLVSIHDPCSGVRGGAYLIHIDPKAGAVLKVQPQK